MKLTYSREFTPPNTSSHCPSDLEHDLTHAREMIAKNRYCSFSIVLVNSLIGLGLGVQVNCGANNNYRS